MNKEQLIQQLKYTKEKHKNDKLLTFDTDISAMCYDILDVLSRCVEIPDNVTNGDIMQTMFPNADIEIHNITVYVIFDMRSNVISFDLDWWNSPYQKGGVRNEIVEV